MLSEILSSDSRAQVFRILFNGEAEEFYLREIERLSGKSIRAIQHEIQHLSEIDLIKGRKDGNRIYYSANKEHPLYLDIVSIVEKTVGLMPLLKEQLKDSRIKCAFVFGSIAKNKAKATSDVDIIVVGDLGMRVLSKLLSGIQESIGREINPHVYSEEEFKRRIKEKDHFITSVLKDEIRPIVGDANDYR